MESHTTIEAVVIGNTTLDILCYHVNEVPRYDSITFERVSVGPGGCGSNVAIGLCVLGIQTALVTRIGSDEASILIEKTWDRVGLDRRYVKRTAGTSTGTSVGLIDHNKQPRFIHITGANAGISMDDLDFTGLSKIKAKVYHLGGFFVLPGLMDDRLPLGLSKLRQLGGFISMDVANSPGMDDPTVLWPCLPLMDIFMCNSTEGTRLTGEAEPPMIARALRNRGIKSVIIKLGAEGCWLASNEWEGKIPPIVVNVIDTTGAGDAFAAGLLSAILRGKDLIQACRAGNEAGARIVKSFGAISGWFE